MPSVRVVWVGRCVDRTLRGRVCVGEVEVATIYGSLPTLDPVKKLQLLADVFSSNNRDLKN